MEVYHGDFGNFLFFKKRMVLINEETDEEGVFETTAQIEEIADPMIFNIYQDTDREYHLEGNFENLRLVLRCGCTINSEDVVDIWHIGITVVDDSQTLQYNIPYVGDPVTEGELYDWQVWVDGGIDPRKAANHY